MRSNIQAVIIIALLLCSSVAGRAAILGYIDFESVPPSTKYGPPALAAGSVAFAESGVSFKVQKFTLPSGGSSYGEAKIETSAAGQMLELNNITLSADFSGLGVTEITMEYRDQVGDKNLQVNGATLHKVAKLADLPATVSQGVHFSFTEYVLPGGPTHGTRGKITLSGPITRLDLGGQEFFIDNIVWLSKR
jgi:hypothetical protein